MSYGEFARGKKLEFLGTMCEEL